MSGICWEPYYQPGDKGGCSVQAAGKLHNEASVRAGKADNLRTGRRRTDNSPNGGHGKGSSVKHRIMILFAWITVISIWTLMATLYDILKGHL